MTKPRNDLGELNDILFARLRALDDPEETKSGILVAKLLSKRYARKKYKQGDRQRNWRRKT